MGELLRTTPIWLLGLLLFVATVSCALAGSGFNRWYKGRFGGEEKLSESQSGYVISMVYALLSLLIGFTFQLAAERFEVRRQLVREDAAAIQKLYLEAQLLSEPHRSRLSNLLVHYGENHLVLAQARRDEAAKLLAKDDQLLRDLWVTIIPAFESVKELHFSTSLVDSTAEIVRIDAARRSARDSPIPLTIVVVLMFYSLVAAAGLGAVMRSRKGQITSVFLLGLSTLALMLIADFNRPVDGTIHESQNAMRRMLSQLRSNPPTVYRPVSTPPG